MEHILTSHIMRHLIFFCIPSLVLGQGIPVNHNYLLLATEQQIYIRILDLSLSKFAAFLDNNCHHP